MPLGVKPVCSSCKSNTSTMWKKGSQGEIICQACTSKLNSNNKEGNGSDGQGSQSSKGNGNSGNGGPGPKLRKSARNKPSKYRVQTSGKPLATKGKSRRIIFKKSQPVKAPKSVSTVVTGNSIYYDGQYYQVGDIVSLVDHDGSVYYAQIRGFLQDQYYEKSAVITWLLPTSATVPESGFDPHTYILGPEEDLPRKMEYIEFVCHAPSDYFRPSKAPYPTMTNTPELCYIWTSVGPEIRLAPGIDEIFGLKNTQSHGSPISTRSERLKEERDKKAE